MRGQNRWSTGCRRLKVIVHGKRLKVIVHRKWSRATVSSTPEEELNLARFFFARKTRRHTAGTGFTIII